MSGQHKVPCFWTWLCVVFSPFFKGASKMPWIQKDRLSLSLHFDCPAYFHTLEKLCDITDFLGKVGNRLAERWRNKPRCPHRGLLSPDLQEELQWGRWERRAERKAVEQTISDPSSLWLEWRHEEGWDGARGKAKSRSWRLEALLVIVLELLLLDIVHCLLISAVTIWLQTLTHLGWWGLCCC